MRTSLLLFILFASSFIRTSGQGVDRRLEADLRELITGFKGEVGIYVKSLRTGKTVEINADTTFPTASIVKVPLLMGVMDRIGRGSLKYHDTLTWLDTIRYDPGEDIIPYLKVGTRIELSKVMMLMMTISDNNASLWLQAIAGGGSAVNAMLDRYGYQQTRVNSRTAGRESWRGVFGWGQTTPREMASIFEDIVRRRIFDTATCDRMLRIMGRQYWDEEALSAIPPEVFVASKNGAVNASRSEVLYVNGPEPYILSIFTRNNEDRSWGPENEAWEMTRKISGAVWAHHQGRKARRDRVR
ncbi:MAG: class A beta-lactamase-related serine hydrolase [Chitinophagaceae bacterium]|jgi:beta-lactamase class A|nr:class A beta-lactamase-related serine hydrolase [Chitinophagaceae bacterium]